MDLMNRNPIHQRRMEQGSSGEVDNEAMSHAFIGLSTLLDLDNLKMLFERLN